MRDKEEHHRPRYPSGGDLRDRPQNEPHADKHVDLIQHVEHRARYTAAGPPGAIPSRRLTKLLGSSASIAAAPMASPSATTVGLA